MALNVGQLKSQIQAVFEQQLESKPQIASKIARAYQAYAAAAQAPPGGPMILKGSESRLFELALTNLMEGMLPAPAAAQALGSAVVGFWLLPPVLSSAGGAATAVVPAAGIAKLMATKVSDVSSAAASLAQSLDLMTKTVFVANSPPLPSGPLF